MTSIGAQAFSENYLTRVTLLSGTTSIAPDAFDIQTAPSGYIFTDWFYNSDLTGDFVDFAATRSDNLTVYASVPGYSVTYDTDGGSAITTVIVDENAKATIPTAPTKEGYDFDGWFKESACVNAWVFDTDVVTAPVILHAKWDPIEYMVTFDSQGGSAIASVTADYGTKITEPAAPAKQDYTFDGWYKENTYANAWVLPPILYRELQHCTQSGRR